MLFHRSRAREPMIGSRLTTRSEEVGSSAGSSRSAEARTCLGCSPYNGVRARQKAEPVRSDPICDVDVACLISAQAKPALSRSLSRCRERAKPYTGPGSGSAPVISRWSYSVPMPFFRGPKLAFSVTGGAAVVSATAPLPATAWPDPGSAGAVGC
jgi:hypothetical protein